MNYENLQSELQELCKLYDKALQVGEAIILQNDKIIKLTDQRHRILKRTAALVLSCRKELIRLSSDLRVEASRKAFLLEQRARVRDYLPRMAEQANRLQQSLGKDLLQHRNRMTQHSHATRAIHAYLRAPQARPLVA